MMPSPSGPAVLAVTPDRITQLRMFGLSEYAARAYLALLQLGTTEARDVSSLSKVPASKIYHILDHLGQKGLVTVLPEFPRKYAPVPFSEFLQRLHDEHEAAAQRLRVDMPVLLKTFAVEGGSPSGDRGSVTLLHGRRNVRERMLEALAGARSEVMVLLTSAGAADPTPWMEPLAAASARGARVRVIGADFGFEWRARPAGVPPPAFALTVDHRCVLLAHILPDDGHPTEGNDTGLFIEQEGLVAQQIGMVGSLWRSDERVVAVDEGPASLQRHA